MSGPLSSAEKIFMFIDEEVTTDLLGDLIRIKSVSDEEGAIAKFIANWLDKSGVTVELQEAQNGRYNVVAKLPGKGQGLGLFFNGHLDVYPPLEGWTMDPYTPVVKEGRCYGSGCVDMKAGLASMLMTMRAIAKSAIGLDGDLIATGVWGHIEGGRGARNLIKKGFKADLGVVCEPTDLKIVVAHPAHAIVEITTTGVGAHDTSREKGVNAILKMMKIIDELESLNAKISKNKHLLLGSPTINVGTIRGGLRHNLVPESCHITVSARLLPGVTPSEFKEQVECIVEELRKKDPEIDAKVELDKRWNEEPRLGLDIPSDHLLVRSLRDAGEKVIGKPPEVLGTPAWTNASLFTAAGMPTIVFGPGEFRFVWPDESVRVEDVVKAARIYVLLALDICKRRKH